MANHEYNTSSKNEQENKMYDSAKEPSMVSLITWNISKALEKNPRLELKKALKETQKNLDQDVVDVTAIVRQRSDERHLSCAVLAWQQLGHEDVDSLCRFVETRINLNVGLSTSTKPKPNVCRPCGITTKDSNTGRYSTSASVAPPIGLRGGSGPVFKLPVEPKIVMRLDNSSSQRSERLQRSGNDLRSRIEQACCLESGCIERLAALDRQIKELRLRLGRLARREADRVELLERAEIAWRNLEMGYMRRHRAAVEKEDDILRENKELVEDRNSYKNACTKLLSMLKPRSLVAEQAQEKLKEMEKNLCAQACERLKQSELSAKEDTQLADVQCKLTQLDRDLQFKEEQARRKEVNADSELESAIGLVYETERALKSELNGLKEQIQEVSTQLLAEDEAIGKTKKDIERLQKEQKEIIEDLEGCQETCDSNMQKTMDELKEKRNKLQELKDKVLDCQCKVPIEESVEVKRTASLAALCMCTPETRDNTCSCTSFRSRLLSDLFSTLFGGLQFELGDISARMPCQMLKCLEDSHNWDKASMVKSNLRNFFAKLLVCELDIAIANSIEKYHAKWVGASCADLGRPIPDLRDKDNWEDRELAHKAQIMASEMAEKMFQEKVDQIMQQAKDVVASGPPPCECRARNDTNAAVFRCTIEPHVIKGSMKPDLTIADPTTSYLIPPKMITLGSMLSDPVLPDPMASYLTTPDLIASDLPTPVVPDPMASDVTTPDLIASDLPTPVVPDPMASDVTTPDLIASDPATPEKLPDDSSKSMSNPNNTQLDSQPAQTITTAIATTLKSLKPIVKPKSSTGYDLNEANSIIQEFWRQTHLDVSFIRAQIEDLKQETIKKEDLKMIEKKLTLAAQRTSGPDTENVTIPVVSTNIERKVSSLKTSRLKKKLNVNSSKPKDTKKKTNDSLSEKPKPVKKQYAVNMCFCGMHSRNSREPKKCSLNNVKSEAKVYLQTKSSKEPLSLESSTLRHNKRILKFPSQENDEDLKNKTISCGSTCACFNKMPSSSSIDRLLDTLTKWKCDLNNVLGIKIQEDTKSSKLNESKINESFKIGCHSTITNTISLMTGKHIDKDINKHDPDKNRPLPATVSEYMGAVNLEKSNENSCKCIVNTEKKNCNIINNEQSERTIKFLNSCKCKNNCFEAKGKQSDACINNTYKEDIQNHLLSKKISSINEKTFKDQSSHQKNKTIPIPSSELFENVDVHKEHAEESIKNIKQEQPEKTLHVNHVDEKSEMLSCNSDYQIKLLGVTLENIHPIKKKTTKTKEKGICKSPQLDTNTFIEKDVFLNDTFPQKTLENLDLFSSKNVPLDEKNQLVSVCKCCSSKFEEMKAFFKKAQCKETGDSNQDKALDTGSLICGLLDNADNCICCINASESNELEVNTFALLEEYLRERVCELKNDCKSECIKSNEENKLLNSIFKKIKQTVKENTGKVGCKCTDELHNYGSWDRAYNLLQEYLKIKISRVQCTCSSVTPHIETILPELTDKVCSLIENDFQRLKYICKCNNILKETTKKQSNEIVIEIPEKDTNSEIYHDIEILKLESNHDLQSSVLKKPSKNFAKTTNNFSVQIIPNFETKSCETSKCNEHDDNMKSVETKRSKFEEPVRNCSVCCNLIDESKIIASHSTQYSKDSDFLLQHVLGDVTSTLAKAEDNVILNDLHDIRTGGEFDSKRNTKEPYIGYTIDGSGLGSCCKSKAQKNIAEINKIWKTYANTQIDNPNVSYIMQNVYKKNDDDDNKIKDHFCMPSDAKPIIPVSIETSAENLGNIVLKDSLINLNKTIKQDGTNTINISMASLAINIDDKLMHSKDCYDEHKIAKTLHSSKDNQINRCRSETVTDELTKACESCYKDCECGTVPICHVKMLMKNIEHKLTHFECTCDSLASNVCPVHSESRKTNFLF